MVKRGGREVITVDIYQETYNLLKAEAKKQRYPVVKYINDMLAMNVEKDQFLREYAPGWEVRRPMEEDRITFINAKTREFAEVFVRDGELRCSLDESTDCIHTHYAWALPEVARLNIKRPPSAPAR